MITTYMIAVLGIFSISTEPTRCRSLNKKSSASRRLLIETFMEELSPILIEKYEFHYRVMSNSSAAYGTLTMRSRIYDDRTEDFETK